MGLFTGSGGGGGSGGAFTSNHPKKKAQSNDDGGFLGTGIGPSLGDIYHTVADTALAVPKAGAGLITGLAKGAYDVAGAGVNAGEYGLAKLAGDKAAAKWYAGSLARHVNAVGGQEVGLLKSVGGTLGDIADIPRLIPGGAALEDATGIKPGDVVRNTIGTGLASVGTLATGRDPSTEANYKIVKELGTRNGALAPQSFATRAKDQGVAMSLLEDVGNVAMVSGGVHGVSESVAGAAEGSHPGLAAAAQTVADISERGAHPLKGVGSATMTPLIRAALKAREEAQVLQPEDMTPTAAATGEPGAPVVGTPEVSPVKPEPNVATPVPEGHTRLYRGIGGDPNSPAFGAEENSRRWFTPDLSSAEKYAIERNANPGHVVQVDVPNDVAQEAIHTRVMGRHSVPGATDVPFSENHPVDLHPSVGTEMVLPEEHVARATPVVPEEHAAWEARAKAPYTPAEAPVASPEHVQAAEGLKAHIEAQRAAQTAAAAPKEVALTPEHPEAAPAHSAGEVSGAPRLNLEEAAAERAAKEAEGASPTANEVARRAEKPIAPWAEKVIQKLGPESRATKALAAIERHGEVVRNRIIARELERGQIEVPRAQDYHEPFIQAIKHAAEQIMHDNPKVTEDDASRMAGEEVTRRLTGQSDVHTPEIQELRAKGDKASLAAADKLANEGVQHPLTPEMHTPAVEQAFRDAVKEYPEYRERSAELLKKSESLGGKGLEDIEANEPKANKNINRLQKQIDQLTKRINRLRGKVPTEVERLKDELAKLQKRNAGHDAAIADKQGLIEEASRQIAALRNHMEPPEPSMPKTGEPQLPGTSGNMPMPKPKTAKELARNTSAEPGETPNRAVQRGLNQAYNAVDIENATKEIAGRMKDKAKTDAAIKELQGRIETGDTTSAKVAAQGEVARARAQARLEKAIDRQPPQSWPRRLRPAGEAYVKMLKDAESDPALKAVVGDAEPTFKAFMARATALGMDPQYVPELTEARVHELSGERVNTRMGKIIEAGARKESEGHLRRMNAVDRSVEAFLAARTAIHQEIATNMGTEFFRKNFGIEVKKGATWDRGDYAFWNPEKQPIPDGGREAMGVRVAPTDGVLIPKSLARAIKRSNADFTGGFETAYKANKYVMNPWRNAVITASPQFYLNHTLGHAVLATIEGVKLHHWTEAVQKWREAADNPLTTNEATDVGGRSIVSQGTTKEPSMLDAGTAKERAARAEGVSGKLAARSHAVAQKLHNITNVVDGVTRTAVYIAKKEKGYTDAEALNKAISNVVDYNDLSPAEQQIARAIIPFYSFQKQILKIVAKFPVDHPVVLGLGANFGRINQHQMQDAFGTKLPLGYQGLIQTGGGGTVNTRGLNPFKDSFSLASPEGIAAAANPLIAGAIRMGFNAPSGGYVKNRKMDAYGNLVPDVGPGDIGYDVTAQLPGVVEAQALAGAGRGPLRGTLKFAGATTYSPDEMQKLVDRIKGTRAAVDANSPYAPTKKKRRSSGGGLFSG